MKIEEILEIAEKDSEKLMMAQVVFEDHGDPENEVYSGAINVLCDIYDDLACIVESHNGKKVLDKGPGEEGQ